MLVVSNCPECDEPVPVDGDTDVTTIVVCPACQSELEVVGMEPVELALAPEMDEDFGE
jgi:alpha-aminoadipate/glutamate carrier protein LysW